MEKTVHDLELWQRTGKLKHYHFLTHTCNLHLKKTNLINQNYQSYSWIPDTGQVLSLKSSEALLTLAYKSNQFFFRLYFHPPRETICETEPRKNHDSPCIFEEEMHKFFSGSCANALENIVEDVLRKICKVFRFERLDKHLQEAL